MNTYTLAQRTKMADEFEIVANIPRNMSKAQAEQLALKARAKGLDVVAYNWNAE